MIGKIVKGRSFKKCIAYVFGDKDARLLASEGVLDIDQKSITNSFYMQSLMNPKLVKSVGHIPLSYSKEDESRLNDAFMVKLAKEYMQAMKIENTQYIIVRHNNTAHPHCHIVFNRVDNNGETIPDKNDHYRNEKVCKILKDKYNLTYGEGKDRTNVQKLKGAEKTRHEIYRGIKASLSIAKNWQQFEYMLNLQGIGIAYKYKGQTGEVQGISFKKGEYSFKGSDIDRSFSYSKLNNQLFEKNKLNESNQPTQSTKPTQQPEQKGVSIVESIIDGLAGASFIEPNGEDYQENAFRERMEYEERKRKKKKRKGFGL